jgi:alpha-L-rhamnosidase
VFWHRAGSSLTVSAIVPPNTTADVLLPGWSHAIPVGSGSHEWTVDAPAPSASHAEAPLGNGTSLAALIDDKGAFDAVLDAIAEVDADTARSFHRQTKWTQRANLGGTFFFLRGPARDAVDRVLDRLNGERTSRRS